MFNDYYKLNKLNFFITIILSILEITLVAMFFIVLNSRLQMDTNTYFKVSRMVYSAVNAATLALVIHIFVSAVKSFVGRNRNMLITHRSRNYYHHMQLVVISLKAILIAIIIEIFKIVSAYFGYMPAETTVDIPPLNYLYTFDIKNVITTIFLVIAIYYTVMYLYNIFFNTNYRYKNMLQKNIAIVGFLFRVFVIGFTSFMIFVSSAYFQMKYYSDYSYLLISTNSIVGNHFGIMVFTLMFALYVDYSIHFKKKVLV